MELGVQVWDGSSVPLCKGRPMKALEELDTEIRNEWALHPRESKEPYQATAMRLGPLPQVSWSE